MSGARPTSSARAEILVVEDDPRDRLILCRLLEKSALNPYLHVASSLAEARGLSQTIRFDCAVVDYHLPDGTAQDFVAEADCAAVVLTGLAAGTLEEQTLQNGAQEFLTKDQMDATRLEGAIQRAMNRHQVRSRIQSELALSRVRASVDSECGLLNRAGLEAELADRLTVADPGSVMAVMLALPHGMGLDPVEIAAALCHSVGDEGLVGRTGEHEYVALFCDAAPELLDGAADRLRHALRALAPGLPPQAVRSVHLGSGRSDWVLERVQTDARAQVTEPVAEWHGPVLYPIRESGGVRRGQHLARFWHRRGAIAPEFDLDTALGELAGALGTLAGIPLFDGLVVDVRWATAVLAPEAVAELLAPLSKNTSVRLVGVRDLAPAQLHTAHTLREVLRRPVGLCIRSPGEVNVLELAEFGPAHVFIPGEAWLETGSSIEPLRRVVGAIQTICPDVVATDIRTKQQWDQLQRLGVGRGTGSWATSH